jgi:hypothetical protein
MLNQVANDINNLDFTDAQTILSQVPDPAMLPLLAGAAVLLRRRGAIKKPTCPS